MTVFDLNQRERDRTVWLEADWELYERALQWTEGHRAFVTFYRGNLEIMTPSFQHDRSATLLHEIVRILANETHRSIVSARSTTLRRHDLNAGLEADNAYYIAHAERMKSGKRDIDLDIDPPPDLVIEVEVTRRLAGRLNAYRDLGVPELWRFDESGLEILLNRGSSWETVDRSPIFPLLSSQEMGEMVVAGLSQDETTWIKAFRQRVRNALEQS